MARPPASPEGRRSIRRGVPLTPSEDAAIVEAAGNRPVAEWMREVVLGQTPRVGALYTGYACDGHAGEDCGSTLRVWLAPWGNGRGHSRCVACDARFVWRPAREGAREGEG